MRKTGQGTQHIFKGRIVEEKWLRSDFRSIAHKDMFGRPVCIETESERLGQLLSIVENPEKVMKKTQVDTGHCETRARQYGDYGEAKVAEGGTVAIDGQDVTVTEVVYDANRDRYTYYTDLMVISGDSTLEEDKEAFMKEIQEKALTIIKEILVKQDARENLYPKFLKEDYEPISYHRGRGKFKVGHLFQIRVEGYGRYQQYYNAVVTRRAPNTVTFRMYRLDDIVIGEAKSIKFKMDIDGNVRGWKMRHLDADKVYIRFKQIEDDTL